MTLVPLFEWPTTSLSCAFFLVPVVCGVVRDLRGSVMVILTSISCVCAGIAYHSCQNDRWCNLTFIDRHSAIEYADLYTTRLLFISLFMRVRQAFDMCRRDLGICGLHVVIRNITWSALNALILMTTITTDELPGEMDYHVFVALSLTIVAVVYMAPNATNKCNPTTIVATFAAFLIGAVLFFQGERQPTNYETLHSLWHLLFATAATLSIYAIKRTPDPPKGERGDKGRHSNADTRCVSV